jgi:hypothetical protein
VEKDHRLGSGIEKVGYEISPWLGVRRGGMAWYGMSLAMVMCKESVVAG